MIPLRYNLRSVMERRTTSMMTVLGVAMVSMIFVILFGFIGGLKQSIINSTGGRENWIVLGRGVLSEGESYIGHDQLEVIRALPQIASDAKHQPLLSMESFAPVNISRGRVSKQIVTIRGVPAIAYEVHRGMRLVEGHWPVRGQGEWVVGRMLAIRFPYLAPGARFHYGHRFWTIVGVFSDRGSSRESEIWTDLDDLVVDRHYTAGACNAIHVVLSAGSGAAFEDAIKRDGRLKVDAQTEAQYYSALARFADELRALGMVVALALALGATFGGMNTMYTAVARREREIGVLRVLGFSRGNILTSFLVESVILGLAGGAAGIVLALAVASATGLGSRMMSVGANFFAYRASPGAFTAGVIAAAIVGTIGGLMPAWRAARITIIESIRET